jgi:hypothetical protein
VAITAVDAVISHMMAMVEFDGLRYRLVLQRRQRSALVEEQQKQAASSAAGQ